MHEPDRGQAPTGMVEPDYKAVHVCATRECDRMVERQAETAEFAVGLNLQPWSVHEDRVDDTELKDTQGGPAVVEQSRKQWNVHVATVDEQPQGNQAVDKFPKVMVAHDAELIAPKV